MKLGGSVLTDKARYRTPRRDTIWRLARELRQAGPMVLVHGAGSFGHILAREHGLATGGGDAMAAARVHADVRELQSLVVRALHDAGLPGVAVSTSDVGAKGAGPRAKDALARRLLPVMSGDVVLDPDGKWGILSGDVIMVELAKALHPTRAIFVTDVDGIHTTWPGGALLTRIGKDDEPFATGSGAPDITGGMGGKLKRARDVAAAGVHVLVLNGHAPGRLADAIAGKPVVGTLVEG